MVYKRRRRPAARERAVSHSLRIDQSMTPQNPMGTSAGIALAVVAAALALAVVGGLIFGAF